LQRQLEPFTQFVAPNARRRFEGIRIGIARDRAFSFVYPANLEFLKAMGAELVFFSPLYNELLPEVGSICLPGGYPELHLEALSQNAGMKNALRVHVEAGKPLLAECGGMLYLLEELVDRDGEVWKSRHCLSVTIYKPSQAR
jgi:cobyrinic acid a,c-diamide synthase